MKCLSREHNVILHGRESNRQLSDGWPDSLTAQPSDPIFEWIENIKVNTSLRASFSICCRLISALSHLLWPSFCVHTATTQTCVKCIRVLAFQSRANVMDYKTLTVAYSSQKTPAGLRGALELASRSPDRVDRCGGGSHQH